MVSLWFSKQAPKEKTNLGVPRLLRKGSCVSTSLTNFKRETVSFWLTQPTPTQRHDFGTAPRKMQRGRISLNDEVEGGPLSSDSHAGRAKRQTREVMYCAQKLDG